MSYREGEFAIPPCRKSSEVPRTAKGGLKESPAPLFIASTEGGFGAKVLQGRVG